MKVIVVGNGSIGRQRVLALNTLGCPPYAILDIDDVLTDDLIKNTDWVFVCTPHDVAVDIVDRVLRFDKKVLVEKPYLGDGNPTNVGLNYRFYKGVQCLLADMEAELFGKLISVNMVLGLGDAPDSDLTWRLDPKRAGRGAILDPGIHLIDLAMIMSNGNLSYVESRTGKAFWGTGIEEETHVLAWEYYWAGVDHYDRNVIYNIQASKVRWRSTFRIEVNGTDGYGIVEGRNRNYGNQTYRRGKRWGWLDKISQRESEELVVDYDGEDAILEETRAVLFGTASEIKPATAEDNKRCIDFINQV